MIKLAIRQKGDNVTACLTGPRPYTEYYAIKDGRAEFIGTTKQGLRGHQFGRLVELVPEFNFFEIVNKAPIKLPEVKRTKLTKTKRVALSLTVPAIKKHIRKCKRSVRTSSKCYKYRGCWFFIQSFIEGEHRSYKVMKVSRSGKVSTDNVISGEVPNPYAKTMSYLGKRVS